MKGIGYVPFKRKKTLLAEEIRGHVKDALACPLSPDRTMALVLDRVNGTASEEVLAAALAVAHEQAQRIAGLEWELSESEDQGRHPRGRRRGAARPD